MSSSRRYSKADVLAVSKRRDAWWTVLLTDPIAIPLVRLLANRSRGTPSQVSALALLVGLCSAVCLAQGDWPFLVAGAVLFQASFVLDCVDGKLARLTRTGTAFGVWVDFILDQIRFLACALALLIGEYARSGRPIYLFAAIAVVFCDLFRYVDATQVAKVRRSIRRELEIMVAGEPPPEIYPLLLRHPDPDAERYGPAAPEYPPNGSRLRRYAALRDRLLRHRVRTHLVSGIEFQMAVCVVAPATTLVLPVIGVAGALLLLFEAGLVLRLWFSVRHYERVLAGPPGKAGRPAAADPFPWATTAGG